MKYGKIAIFANDKEHEKQPDYKGKITVTETMKPGEYEIGIYNNEAKSGLKYQSGVITEPWKKAEVKHQDRDETPSYDSENIPF